jgi:hypothetical protein
MVNGTCPISAYVDIRNYLLYIEATKITIFLLTSREEGS